MKTRYLLQRLLPIVFFAFVASYSNAQDSVSANFEKKGMRIVSGSKKQVETNVKVKIARNDRLQNYTVKIGVDKNTTTLPADAIFLPADNTITLNNTKDTIEKTFKIMIIRDDNDDKNLSLTLSVFDDKGNPANIKKGNTVCDVYIKPLGKDPADESDPKSKDSVFAIFENTEMKIPSGTKKQQIKAIVKIRVAKNDKLKNYKVKINIDKEHSSLSTDDIYLPTDISFTIDNSKDTMEKYFTILVNRDDSDDKILALSISATDEKGSPAFISKGKTTCSINIKPFSPDSVTQGKNQFWIFTGTNLDVLDGVKARDLYFKLSYLYEVPFKNSRGWWLYTCFGENRYFSQSDSFKRIQLIDGTVYPKNPDSIAIINGFYSTSRTIVTQNTYISVAILKEILASETNQMFAMFEGYYASQNITYTYSNYDMNTDTSIYAYKKDSGYRFTPPLYKNSLIQANYNLGLGLMWIYHTDELNIKFQAITGYNSFNYPYSKVTHGTSEMTFYKKQQTMYGQFRLEANVIDPAGISLGIEMFIRQGQFPLWNISISKLLDFRHIANLFSPVANH